MADSGTAIHVRRIALGVVLGGATLLAAASAVLSADQSVAISGFSFSPKTVTVSVGDTVTWTNSDAQGHTATADDGSFNTGAIPNGASDSVTFSTAGTFAYHCSIHSDMTGSVVVQAAAGGGAGAQLTPPAGTDTEPEGASAGSSGTTVAAIFMLATVWLAGLAIARRWFARPLA